ncbi:MAG: O-antigen ligase family protein [Candidatus Woesebacteria bacterium]
MNSRVLQKIQAGTFHFLLVILPLVFTISNDELFEFPKMLLIYAAALVLLSIWIIRSIQTQKIAIPRTPFDLPILLFVGSQILSTVFSIDPHTSLYGYYSRFNGGLFSVLSYTILFYSAADIITKENLNWFIKSFFLGAGLTALYAFPEHFGHSPSCLLITGSFDAHCWVQDVQTRVFGTLGQPNWLAAYMAVALPLVATKIIGRKWSVDKLFPAVLWPLAFALYALVLLYTKSRSGILAAGIALTVQIVVFFLVRPHQKIKDISSSLFPFIVFALLTLCITNPVKDKLFSILHISSQTSVSTGQTQPSGTQLESGGSESGDIRRVVWTGALRVWQRYPIFGSGVETFAYSYYKDRPKEHNLLSEWDFLYNKAHNEFLNYLATTGIVGFGLYISMYGSFILLPFWWIYRKQPRSVLSGHRSIAIEVTDTEPYSFSTILFLTAGSCALLGLGVSNFFGFSTVVVSFLTFFLPALTVISANKKRILTIHLPTLLKDTWVQRIFIGIVLFCTLSSLFSVFSMWDADRIYAKGKGLLDQSELQSGALLIQEAAKRVPNEPVYEDKLSATAAELSYALSASADSTSAAALAQTAIDHSDAVITAHPANVNFYKTRVHIFTLLAQISPVFYDEATKALLAALDLSPTDPKLTHNLAFIAKAQGKTADQEKYLKETLELRPIDISTRLELGAFYEEQKRIDDAKTQYQAVLQLDPENASAKTRIASISAVPKKK